MVKSNRYIHRVQLMYIFLIHEEVYWIWISVYKCRIFRKPFGKIKYIQMKNMIHQNVHRYNDNFLRLLMQNISEKKLYHRLPQSWSSRKQYFFFASAIGRPTEASEVCWISILILLPSEKSRMRDNQINTQHDCIGSLVYEY